MRFQHYNVTRKTLALPEEGHSPEVKRRMDELYVMMQAEPRRAIGELEAVLARYPNDRMLYNWLAAAFANSGQTERAMSLARTAYKRFPDYLFARTNYVIACLNDKNLEEAARALDGKTDVHLMYPKRKVFHVTEVLGFALAYGQYCDATGNTAELRKWAKRAAALDEDHPNTRRLLACVAAAGLRKLHEKIAERTGAPQHAGEAAGLSFLKRMRKLLRGSGSDANPQRR